MKKIKNSFSKLRGQLRVTKNELDTFKRGFSLVKEENERLKNALELEQKTNKNLDYKLSIECKRTNKLTNRVIMYKNHGNYYFKKWMEDHSKISKYSKLLSISIITNIAMILFVIWGLK